MMSDLRGVAGLDEADSATRPGSRLREGKGSALAAHYPTHRHTETATDLIARVTRVSVETVAITRAMAEASDLE